MKQILLILSTIVMIPASQGEETPTPLFQTRTLYAPGHFGNSYEVMSRFEMWDLLEEAKFWGFNEYSDWFDTIDCADPFIDKHYNLAGALWDRKKENLRTAQVLGFARVLVITPNHVFLDQVRPEIEATKEGRIFGQLLCPSITEGREIILKNYRNLFEDLSKFGVHLNALAFCPYDYGGCACDKCAPWILTFAELTKEIHQIALESHPGIEARFIGWWWTPEEHQQFAEWADREAPGWAKAMALHIPYGKTGVADVPLPKGCERHAFVHIGYGDVSSDRDIYGHLGPVCAAARIAETVKNLRSEGVTGWMAYSEGVFDDVNKALLAGLSSGVYNSAREILETYAERYFHADTENRSEWASWLTVFGRPFDVDLAQSRKVFSVLTEGIDSKNWRLKQWALKLKMLELNSKIEASEGWTDSDFNLAEEYWRTKDELRREVWGLGPQRHVLADRFKRPSWAGDWEKARVLQKN
ncbi:MAG: hypothetical protein KC964_17235 [Candidatus Omnitrophica bacterium]|nr:hypothetical protein [Candidatus Omnitrophota bacterium]